MIIDLFKTGNNNCNYIFEKGNSNVADVKLLEGIARERLLQYFPNCTVGLACLPNQADYTDVPAYKRGQMTLNINTDNALALLAVINTAKCLGIEVKCKINHTTIWVW